MELENVRPVFAMLGREPGVPAPRERSPGVLTNRSSEPAGLSLALGTTRIELRP